MARGTALSSLRHIFYLTGSTITLARWRLRNTWSLLLMLELGLVAAVLLVCSLPLFSAISTTAGLRSTLRDAPDASVISLSASTQGFSSRVTNDVHAQLDELLQKNIGPYLRSSTPFSISATDFSHALVPEPFHGNYTMSIVTTNVAQASQHMRLLQGRLPRPTTTDGVLEIMLTPETAEELHTTVGSTLALPFAFTTTAQGLLGDTGPFSSATVKLHVVGFFHIATPKDPFWFDEDFTPHGSQQTTFYPLLFSDQAFLQRMDQIASEFHTDAIFLPRQQFTFSWAYRLDDTRLTIDQLDDLTERLNTLQAKMSDTYGDIQQQSASNPGLPPTYPYIENIFLFSSMLNSLNGPGTLVRYQSHLAVARIPVTLLALQITALILFFVSLMTGLLVDRHADAIATMNSRGASNSQIFGALLLQCIGLAICALIIGPPLAIMLTSLVTMRVLTSAEQDARSLIAAPFGGSLPGTLALYASLTILVALIAMSISLRRAASMDILATRRESARSSHRPFWQRFNLDVFAGVIALTGYLLSLYLNSVSTLLDTGTKTLISSPLALIAPLFLIIGFFLLFLRLYPLVLRLAAWFAVRTRGAITMLALAQMARAPRHTLRMTMLLGLAISFTVFTFVFTASQSQRNLDMANYQSGADFRGQLPFANDSNTALQDVTAEYQAIPGVVSITAGYSERGFSTGNVPSIPIEVRAVNADTFGRTALWPTQASTQSLSQLMQLLIAHRAETAGKDVVPVIIDTTVSTRLKVHDGSTFSVNISQLGNSLLHCVVIGEVEHIPTINDSTEAGSESFIPPGGILLDYQSFAAVYKRDAQSFSLSNTNLPINQVWLSTRDDPRSLASVRQALLGSSLQLTNLYDRRELISTLQSDPLYQNLISVLILGTIAALLLALLGNLLASWLSAHTRLSNFALLRALGTTPRQVASVLAWEQAIIYLTALLLGSIFGALLSVTTVPILIFNAIPSRGNLSTLSNDEFYALQHVLPTRIVVPFTLSLTLLALIIICIIALGMMVRVVSRPSLSQTLRLNDD